MFSPWTVSFIVSQLGKPYHWGGDDPINGWDCSGLVCEILIVEGLLKHGSDLNAQSLHDHFSKAENGLVAMGPMPSALAFYGESKKSITHVALFVDYKRVVTASGGGSDTVSSEIAAKKNAFVKLRPFDYRKDLVAIVLPSQSA